MIDLGFSYVGFIYLLMLFIPNIISTKYIPLGYDEIAEKEDKILLLFERVGQIAVTFFALIFKNFNIGNLSIWSIWLIISFIVMLVYEASWIRYFKSEHTLKDFYRNLLSIPVPLVTLPILAFLLLGIYGKVIWMIISALVLGIGHIGIHFKHINFIKINNK